MRKVSRSSHMCHRECPRKHYNTYLKDGTGYTTKGTNPDFAIGLACHKGLEEVLRENGIEVAVREGLAELKAQLVGEPLNEMEVFHRDEMGALVEALLRGWFRTRWPSFKEQYEVLEIEKERRTLLAPNVNLMSREDALLRNREDGRLVLLNWKTTSSISDWDKKWKADVQAWTEALAVEAGVGETVAGCLFEGLYKGVRKDNRQCSSLLYGYKAPDNPKVDALFRINGWMYRVSYAAYSKATPWARFAVWKEGAFGPSPLDFWIRGIPWDEVSSYFVTSNPIFKDDAITQKWINQLVRTETEIERMLQEDISEGEREIYFSQNFSYFNCKRCTFEKYCFEKADMGEDIASGKLVPRVDHHAMEGEE